MKTDEVQKKPLQQDREGHGSIVIAPSILSADMGSLGAAVAGLKTAGADWVHLDVMDGRFVPNLTIGPPVIAALRRHADLFFDAHLMIEAPERSVGAYRQAGADGITVHAEACVHLHRTLQQIRDLGARPGVALNPATPVEAVEWVLEDTSLVLVMSVNPGFGGQAFITSALRKIERLAEMRARLGLAFRLEVDGGISAANAAQVVRAGADTLVAGQAVFANPKGDVAYAIRELRTAAMSS